MEVVLVFHPFSVLDLLFQKYKSYARYFLRYSLVHGITSVLIPIFSKLQRMNELEYYLNFMYVYWPLSNVLLTIFKLEENLLI